MTNCLIFALRLWWRRRRGRLGYVTMRRSLYGPFPHFLYLEVRRGRPRFISYVPLAPRHRLVPPAAFRGRVHWGR